MVWSRLEVQLPSPLETPLAVHMYSASLYGSGPHNLLLALLPHMLHAQEGILFIQRSSSQIAQQMQCTARAVRNWIRTLREERFDWLQITGSSRGTLFEIHPELLSNRPRNEVGTKWEQDRNKLGTSWEQPRNEVGTTCAGTPRATHTGVTIEKNSLSENLKRGSRGTAVLETSRERTRDAVLPLLPSSSSSEFDFVSWLDHVTREAGFHLAPSTMREVERQLAKSPLERDQWQDFAMDRICDLADRRGERDDYALSRALREDCHTWVAPSQASAARKSSKRNGCSGEETKVEEVQEAPPRPKLSPLKFLLRELVPKCPQEQERLERLARGLQCSLDEVHGRMAASGRDVHWLDLEGNVIRIDEGVRHG